MSIGIILLWIAVATVITILLIMKWKINPTIGLCIGAIILGAGCNIGLANTASAIGSGFGNLMVSLGLPIGFGVILGELLSRCGGCRVIAQTMIRGIGEKRVLWAIALTGFILSVPVFFDVAFIILIPLCIEVCKEINKPLPYAAGAVCFGALATHFLIPPTPLPLVIPDYFPDVNMGIVIGLGVVVSAITVFLGLFIYYKFFLDRGFFKDSDFNNVHVEVEKEVLPEKLPSFGMSMLPILLPVVLLVFNTLAGAIGIDNDFINFISNRNVAMMIGALAAYLVASVNMDTAAKEAAGNKAMGDAGVVMLVTGAGGSFATVISATGLSDRLAEALSVGGSPSKFALLFVAYGIAAVFRLSLGSGTTAGITSLAIMSGVVAASGGSIGMNSYWLAVACLAGAMSFPHINDSAFWVVANMSGFKPTGSFKTYSTGALTMSIIMMIIALIGAVVF